MRPEIARKKSMLLLSTKEQVKQNKNTDRAQA